MTLTPEQIDAALPHVPAGVAALSGDLTDEHERSVAVTWLLAFYQAVHASTEQTRR